MNNCRGPDSVQDRSETPKHYGCRSMVDPLRRVLVRRPDTSFAVKDPVVWHYTATPDLPKAQEEHDSLTKILKLAGIEVIVHDEALPEMADSIFVFDPAIVTEAGAVILKMGKALRRGEEDGLERRLKEVSVPILARLRGSATAEGGDLLWLDAQTLAIGIGFRTNWEGFNQLENVLGPLDISLLPVELPYWEGPDSCLHLLSLISLLDEDLAVVYPPLVSIPFWQELRKRGIGLVEVPAEEFPSMGANVLALKPRKCVMLEGNPVTRHRLEKVECEVLTYSGQEISRKAEGGPTCLTLPIWRRP